MKTEKAPLPAYIFRFLAWFCPDHLFEEIEGDLIQKFQRDSAALGESRAKRRLAWNTLRFFRPGVILRNPRFNASALLNLASASAEVNFKRANTLTGWLVFAIALVTYVLTVEETASLWDCSEFIAASTKLQVPHPPGAPLFLLVGRIFSLMALDDPTRIAYAVNLLSALASAFTILFLFWSIVLFGRKLTGANGSPVTREKTALLLGAGIAGALAFAYSDSFWFSAVEAEVYAMSSFFTALVVWCILKWDLIENKSQSNRWLILIAYAVGLSIGVHLLNLLTLPALALIYYFKRYRATARGIIFTLIASTGLTLFIYDVVIPGIPTLAGKFELFFVNSMGLSFGSGAIVFSILFIGTLMYLIHFTHKRSLSAWNTLLLAGTFVIIGYGSYATIVIRSGFDPPMNQNTPKDVMSFVRYLNRDQYGTRPLLYGPYFTSEPVGLRYGDPVYIKGGTKYEESRRSASYTYEPRSETFLPRAWDADSSEEYRTIIGLREGQRPSFIQNIGYMLTHQVGTMYLRYFMWNFAGRESDQQGAGWLTPSDWFKKIPASLAENKGRNNFFLIPLALGLAGMSYQYAKDRKSWAVVGALFVMLGVAIVIYLNSPPAEPRERDYIYAGSYYAFAIWIGLSVIALADALGRIIRYRKATMAAAVLAGLAAPLLMAIQGWDDHDRSDRFFSVDSASNMLTSCEPNAVIFTGGDNDSFPLWYAQDAEGIRTDVRALVLSYYNADWYIGQTMRKAYESDPLPYTVPEEKYRQGGPNDYLPFMDAGIESMEADEFLKLIANDNPLLKRGNVNIVPSKTITLSVDKNDILSRGIVPQEFNDLIVDKMELRLLDDHLLKRDLVFLDLLVTNDWKRPIYLNNTSLSQLSLDLRPYIVQEGNAYRVLPVRNPDPENILVNTTRTYDLMVNRFRYRALDDPDVYYNDDYKIQVMSHRSNLNSLARALLSQGKARKAEEVLLFSLDKMPDEAVPYDPSATDTVSLLFRAGQKEKAVQIAKVIGEQSTEVARYLIAQGGELTFELRKQLFMLGSVQRILFENNENDLARGYEENYTRMVADLQRKMKG